MTARADTAQVVPAFQGAAGATATGAFVLSADAKSVKYRVTWDGLTTGEAARIDLHNFGRGATGSVVATLCGGTTGRPCTGGRSGTIEGTVNVDAKLAREMATERLYVDVHTGSAAGGEIRGQILPLPWMVHSQQFLGRLTKGTATLYITDFPQGTQMQLDMTIANLPAGNTVVEFRRGAARVGTLRTDRAPVQRRGNSISAVLSASAGTAPEPGVIAAVRSGRATLAVLVGGRVVGTVRLEAIE